MQNITTVMASDRNQHAHNRIGKNNGCNICQQQFYSRSKLSWLKFIDELAVNHSQGLDAKQKQKEII